MFSLSVVSDSATAMDYSPPGSSVHRDSPGKNTGVSCHFLLQGNLPDPGIEPGFPALQGRFFTRLSNQGSTETPPLIAKIVLDKPSKPTALSLSLSAQESWRGRENEAMVTNPWAPGGGPG